MLQQKRTFFVVDIDLANFSINKVSPESNYISVKPPNVPMKSLNVGNEEILHEVKVIGEYTITAAMKEDIHRDMAHLYVLLDQCMDEDILQQIRRYNQY